MASRAYSDNLNSKQDGVTLRDYNHASRLFLNNNLKFAPKTRFLYHCFFALDPSVGNVLRSLTQKYTTEIGMLVKTADLPRYTAQVETRNKYNRKKNIQTQIQYDPITITFHDDNHGITSALLEAYYRFYYADAWHGDQPGAYSKLDGDNTFKGSARHQFRYGLDNNISVPFFRNIQLSQLSRSQFTTYTLVNPIITNWQHDNLDSSDNSFMQNTITIQYEAVHYDRGTVTIGDDGEPTGFGSVHYDSRPSILAIDKDNTDTSGTDLIAQDNRDYNNTQPEDFNQNQTSLSNIPTNPNFSLTNLVSKSPIVGGLSNYNFPKSQGTGGIQNIASAQAVSVTNSSSSTTLNRLELQNNPAELDNLAKQQFKNDFLADGGSGGTNGISIAWSSLSETQRESYRRQVLENAV